MLFQRGLLPSPGADCTRLPGASNAGRPWWTSNQGNLKSVNVVQAGGRSRVVLNPKQATSYRTEIQGKALLVQLDPVAISRQPPERPSRQPCLPKQVPPMSCQSRMLIFAGGPDGSGRIIVSLSSSQVGVDLRQVGKG